MKNKHSEQPEPDMITIFIGTWNMGGSACRPASQLCPWALLCCLGHRRLSAPPPAPRCRYPSWDQGQKKGELGFSAAECSWKGLRSCQKWKVLGKECEYIGGGVLGHLPALGSSPRGFRPGRRNLLFDLGCQIYWARKRKKDDAQLNLNFL